MGLRTALLRTSLAMASQTFLKALTCKLPTLPCKFERDGRWQRAGPLSYIIAAGWRAGKAFRYYPLLRATPGRRRYNISQYDITSGQHFRYISHHDILGEDRPPPGWDSSPGLPVR
jgi:hypothetical protein